MNADKISLIYEFNNNSPLFARVAELELNKLNIEKAIEILEKGMSVFPDYPSARIIYAKALASKGDLDEAEIQIKKASEYIDSEKSEQYYLNELQNVNPFQDEIKSIRKSAFFSSGPAKESGDNLENAMNELRELAKEIEGAKIIPQSGEVDNPEDYEEKSDSNSEKIVSETLAGIYIAQENYNEAISIYEKLIEVKPENTEKYESKIEEIKKNLENE